MAPSDAPDTPTPTTAGSGANAYASLSSFVFLVGLSNGVAPFVVRFLFGGDALLIALPLRLPSPWWWIVSLTVVATAAVLLELLDRAGRRADGVHVVDETYPREH